MKIERQGFAVVYDPDRNIGFSVGQVPSSPDGAISISISEWRRANSAKSGMSRCVARVGGSVTAEAPHALVAPENARLQQMRRRFHLVRELEDLLARGRQAIARRQLLEHQRPEAFLELGDTSPRGRMVHTEARGGSPDRASARDRKKITNVIPVDHGASCVARRAFQSPYLIRRTAIWAVIIACANDSGQIPNGRTPIVAAGVSRPAGSISHHRCARFRTQQLTPATHFEVLGGKSCPDTTKEEVMRKLEDKVAVITGGSSGMALASARRFVEEGAYVFITGRRQEALDEAVKTIGRNVTGVRGDAANLDDLDRLFDTVKREKGRIDVLYASAGTGEAVPLGEITEQHFDATFGLNTRGTLFTVQKALPLFNDGGSIFMTGSVASLKGFPVTACTRRARRRCTHSRAGGSTS